LKTDLGGAGLLGLDDTPGDLLDPSKYGSRRFSDSGLWRKAQNLHLNVQMLV